MGENIWKYLKEFFGDELNDGLFMKWRSKELPINDFETLKRLAFKEDLLS